MSPEDVRSGSFAGAAGATHSFANPVAEGEKLFFDFISDGPCCQLWWRLFDPVGQDGFSSGHPRRFEDTGP